MMNAKERIEEMIRGWARNADGGADVLADRIIEEFPQLSEDCICVDLGLLRRLEKVLDAAKPHCRDVPLDITIRPDGGWFMMKPVAPWVIC